MIRSSLALDLYSTNPVFIDDLPTPKSLRVLYISSYVPRKCGIATFCRDLAQGVSKSDPGISVSIMAMVDKMSQELEYPSEVNFLVRQNEWSDYQLVLDTLALTDSVDVVCVQHEYGIFGGPDGEWILQFLEKIDKPIVTTLHTIMPNPLPNQKRIIQELCKLSNEVVVMLNSGIDILSEVYDVSTNNINVIPHGVPNFQKVQTEKVKKDLGLEGKIVMTSINLLSTVKGVEYGIRSLPSIVKEFPNFIYQIVGETHPVFLKNDLKGVDTYRQGLIQLAKDLGVEKNVHFVNRYVSVEDLVKYVEGSDFYVTPYLDPQQATSGALAYAIGAGKVCISTPYLYAKEMLRKGRGILVDFKDHEAIARSVVRLIKNPDEKVRREHKTYLIGKEMNWLAIGQQYVKIFHGLINSDQVLLPYTSSALF